MCLWCRSSGVRGYVPFTCKFPMVMHFVPILHRCCRSKTNFYVFSYDKISLKFCASLRFFLAVFMEKFQKNLLSEQCETRNSSGSGFLGLFLSLFTVLCPRNGIRGHLVFDLSVCLSRMEFGASSFCPICLSVVEKNSLTLAINFDLFEVGVSYFTCTLLVRRPFHPYQDFWPSDLDRDLWPTYILYLNTLTRNTT